MKPTIDEVLAVITRINNAPRRKGGIVWMNDIELAVATVSVILRAEDPASMRDTIVTECHTTRFVLNALCRGKKPNTCQWPTLAKRLQDLGLQPKDLFMPPISTVAQQYYDLFMQGMSPSEIARQFGKSPCTVTTALFKLAAIRGLRHYDQLRTCSTPVDSEDVIPEMSPQVRKYYDLYMQGTTPAEIARLLNKSVGTVLAGIGSVAASQGLKHYRQLRRGLPPVQNASPTTPAPDVARPPPPAPEVKPEPPKPIAVSVNPRGEVVAVQSAPLLVTSPMVATPGDYAKATKPLAPTTSTKIDPVSKDILVITTERIAFGTPAWCERMAALHVKKT